MRDFLARTEKKNQCNLTNKLMYVKPCCKSSTLRNDESNSNINIFKILHLPFDILCYFIEIIMILCNMHWQSASPSELPAVQKLAPGTMIND